jgi:hypothetical protein
VTTDQVDGKVKVVAPGGDVAVVIQGNIKSGLKPSTAYEVYVRSLPGELNVGTFTTNGNGHGRFHVNIRRSADLPAGIYDIQVAINVGGATVIATPRDLLLTVTVTSGEKD